MKDFPKFPRTKHLPYKPNCTRDDLIATENEVRCLFESDNVFYEEKVDGANVGIYWENESPMIRNRNHILNKAYMKDTTAKRQFRPLWNWTYAHYENFQELRKLIQEDVVIYGEWLYATHSLHYTSLPDYFIAFDLYLPNSKIFLNTNETRKFLQECKFYVPNLLFQGKISSYKEIDEILYKKSSYSDDIQEGIYVKICDNEKVVSRLKIVRENFICGEHWSNSKLIKNELS